MFERLLQSEPGLAGRCQFYLSQHLLALQLRYPLLIRGSDGRIAGLEDSVEQRFDLLEALDDSEEREQSPPDPTVDLMIAALKRRLR